MRRGVRSLSIHEIFDFFCTDHFRSAQELEDTNSETTATAANTFANFSILFHIAFAETASKPCSKQKKENNFKLEWRQKISQKNRNEISLDSVSTILLSMLRHFCDDAWMHKN